MTTYAQFDKVLVEREERLLIATLNRPHVLNAVGDGLHEELEELFGLVGSDDSVSAMLLMAAGRSFCAGADMKELDSPGQNGTHPVARVDTMMGMTRRLVTNMLSIDKPIVAAVQGYALGMGATLALFCDIVFAAEDAVFADNHVTVGLVAGDGGAVIWPLLLPINTAKYYLLTGDRIDGVEAARLGLVHKAVPGERLVEEAKALARRLAHGAPLAVRGTKRALNKILQDRVDLLLEGGLTAEGITFLSDDHKEAAAAFVDKRAPVFLGH
jgi:enoyl-CoA hydratase